MFFIFQYGKMGMMKMVAASADAHTKILY